MWYVYKAYDQRHAGSSDLKTVDKVLNLSSEDEVWKHAQKSRTNFLNDDLVSCVNKFLSHIPEDHFEANLSEILFLILYHFKGMENDFFKNFSEDIQIKAILLSKTRDYQVL